MKKILIAALVIALAASFLTLQVSAVLAIPPEHSHAGGRGFGALWLNGEQVATLVPSGKPIKNPSDPLYAFPDQSSVIEFGPGDPEFNGGHWEVWAVTWHTTPYLITSFDELQTALDAGDITVARNQAGDVLCPVLPGKAVP